jgi:hypothetical protein
VLYLFSNGSSALLVLLLIFSIHRTKQAFFVWFWGLSVLIMLLLINARFGVLLEVRYLLALWIPLAIAAASGVERLTRYNGWLGVCIICIWVASGIWTSTAPQAAVALHNPHWHLPWREFRAELTPRVQSGDRAVFLLPDWTWAVYHEDEINYYLHDLPVEYALMEQPEHIGDDQYQQQAQTILTDASRVWVASTADQPLTHSDDFQSILDQNGFLQCETNTSANPLALELYGKVDENTASEVSFGPTPLITLTPVGELPAQGSDLASIPMIWTIDDPSVAPLYSFALHLQNADDQLVAQADYGIPQAEQACSVATISVHDLPAGEYTLFATVYAWETGERLAVQDAGNFTATPDSRIELGRIQVED